MDKPALELVVLLFHGFSLGAVTVAMLFGSFEIKWGKACPILGIGRLLHLASFWLSHLSVDVPVNRHAVNLLENEYDSYR